MSNTRNLADLLDSSGDVKSAALDNVPATDISGKLNTSGGTLTGTLTMESTDAGSTAEPELILYRNSPSPASGDYLGQIQFKGENANGGSEIYAKVTGKISDPTHSSEDGLIETAIKGNGSFTIVSRQKSDELQLINGVNLDVAGNITVGGTVDGVDIQTLNTTASAALPKAGGTMTGALSLQNNVSNSTSATLKLTGSSNVTQDNFILFGDNATSYPIAMGFDNSENTFKIARSANDDLNSNIYFKMSSTGVISAPIGVELGGGLTAATANTLDDYEEGNHSATFFPGNSGSITMGRSSLGYVKIGKVVTITGECDVGSVSSPIGGLRVTLPFAIASHTSERNMSFVTRPGMYHVPHHQDNPPLFIGHAGSSSIEGIKEQDDGAFVDYNPQAGETMWFCFSYFTDS